MRSPNGRSASLALISVGCHLLSYRPTAMKRTFHILLVFVARHLIEAQEENILSELPFAELLAQRKILECRNLSEGLPAASALVGEKRIPEKEIRFRGLRKHLEQKTFHEDDYEDDKGHVSKKKKNDKMHDILNTSVMALSYLAFGGYLLCLIASALREKRRRIMMAYPTAGSAVNNQLAQVLQHYMTHRPVRPVIRFPTVTVHHGGKKRRRRFIQRAPRVKTNEGFL